MAGARPSSRRLRVVFCTRGGLFGALVLRRLRACDQVEVCGIVRSSRMFNAQFGAVRGALAYIRRSGLAYALYLLCATTLADMLCGFGKVGAVPTRTRPDGIPVHTTRDVNNSDGLRFLSSCAPDLLVSAFFDQRLQEAGLAIPSVGCVNIHPSLLPALRGVDPVLQACVQRVEAVGVTVHKMAPALDSGEILAQRRVNPPAGATVFETTAILFREGAELLVRQVGQLAGPVRGAPQQSAGSYQSWPTRAELRALRALGGALIRPADFRRMLA